MKTPHQKIVDVLAPEGDEHGGAGIVAHEILEALAPMTTAIELAYGLLWHVAVDRHNVDGRRISLARRALLAELDRAGQNRGITAARELVDAPESRKNSRSASTKRDNPLQHRYFMPPD